MVKIYIELTARKSGLTQIGYYQDGNSFVPPSKVIQIPFSLVDEAFAPAFDYGTALKKANSAVRTLNMGFYKSIMVDFVEVANEL